MATSNTRKMKTRVAQRPRLRKIPKMSSSLFSDDENPFSAMQDGLIFENWAASRDVFHHVCMSKDEDPFVGLLNDKGARHACCTAASFIRLPSDKQLIRDKYYTLFARKLIQLSGGSESTFYSSLKYFAFTHPEKTFEQFQRYLSADAETYSDPDDVQWSFDECSVCLAPCRFVRKPPCCRKGICQLCWDQYVNTSATNSMSVHLTGMYDLRCYACTKFVPYSEAIGSIDPKNLEFLRPPGHSSCALANCPVCLNPFPPYVIEGKQSFDKMLRKLQKIKGGRPINCERCENVYCGACGLLAHPKFTCKQLTASSEGLQTWAKQQNTQRPEFPNGRRCPSCKINVSHNGGCPHMTCPCGTNWCFSCGRRYILKKFHTNNRFLPLASCPKMWKSTPKRIAVHSAVSVGLITASPLAIAAAAVAAPIFGSVLLVAKLKHAVRRYRSAFE